MVDFSPLINNSGLLGQTFNKSRDEELLRQFNLQKEATRRAEEAAKLAESARNHDIMDRYYQGSLANQAQNLTDQRETRLEQANKLKRQAEREAQREVGSPLLGFLDNWRSKKRSMYNDAAVKRAMTDLALEGDAQPEPQIADDALTPEVRNFIIQRMNALKGAGYGTADVASDISDMDLRNLVRGAASDLFPKEAASILKAEQDSVISADKMRTELIKQRMRANQKGSTTKPPDKYEAVLVRDLLEARARGDTVGAQAAEAGLQDLLRQSVINTDTKLGNESKTQINTQTNQLEQKPKEKSKPMGTPAAGKTKPKGPPPGFTLVE